MEEKIAEICEIEAELYLDYYNKKYKFNEFIKKLEDNQKKIINLVYDLLESGKEEKEILSAIKMQGEFYKESPEYFGEDDESSNYPSGYIESSKSKNINSMKMWIYFVIFIKIFKTRKATKRNMYQIQICHLDDGMREIIYIMKAMKKKKINQSVRRIKI